jgi:tellurite resistance protein
MEAKLRRMAGKHKRARTALRLAYLILAAKGALPELERTELRRLCALLDVEPEQVWEELGG